MREILPEMQLSRGKALAVATFIVFAYFLIQQLNSVMIM